MKSSGRKKATHSTLKRTILTHIQMVSIIMSLKVSWPETVRSIMVGLGSVISIAGHTDSIHCSLDTQSVADVFYGTMLATIMLPVAMVLLTWIYWFLLVPSFPFLGCVKDLQLRKFAKISKNPFAKPSRMVSNPMMAAGEAAPSLAARNRRKTIHWKSNRDGWVATNVYFIYIIFPSIGE
jgi:hypothetical protein